MITKRIIACLDVHGGRVVKGVQFVDLVDAGDPATQAARHAREGADEIVLLDITATHEGRATLLDTVRRTARESLEGPAQVAEFLGFTPGHQAVVLQRHDAEFLERRPVFTR